MKCLLNKNSWKVFIFQNISQGFISLKTIKLLVYIPEIHYCQDTILNFKKDYFPGVKTKFFIKIFYVREKNDSPFSIFLLRSRCSTYVASFYLILDLYGQILIVNYILEIL